MADLESLPIDIKFIILSLLPTARSLRCLCYASAGYRSVYENYQSRIQSSVFYDDALGQYAREGLWLARYHNLLHNAESKRYPESRIVYKAKMEYMLYPYAIPPEFRPSTDHYFCRRAIQGSQKEIERQPETSRSYGNPTLFAAEGGSECRRKVVQNHKTILEITRRILTKKLLKSPSWEQLRSNRKRLCRKAEESVYLLISEGEEERIIAAIYRFLVAINVTYLHSSSDRTGFKDALDTWGWRGMAAVRVVRDFFVEVFAPIEEALPKDRHWEIGSVIPEAHRWRPKKPLLPSRMILLHQFPDKILPWLDGEYFQNRDWFHERLRQIEIAANVPRDRDFNPDEYEAGSFYFADADVKPSSDNDDDFRYATTYSRDEIPIIDALLHRRCFATNSYPGVNESVSRYYQINEALFGPRGHSPGFDPEAAIWDFDKLDQLGYCSCNWRLSRSERYQPVDNKAPKQFESTWQSLGSGCILLCEPYESDIHADEHLLNTDFDDWVVFGRTTRYKDKRKWKNSPKCKQDRLIGPLYRGCRSKPRARHRTKQTPTTETEAGVYLHRTKPPKRKG